MHRSTGSTRLIVWSLSLKSSPSATSRNVPVYQLHKTRGFRKGWCAHETQSSQSSAALWVFPVREFANVTVLDRLKQRPVYPKTTEAPQILKVGLIVLNSSPVTYEYMNVASQRPTTSKEGTPDSPKSVGEPPLVCPHRTDITSAQTRATS